MYCFIYVFTKEAANRLIAHGFDLIKSDEKNKVYVFENKQGKTFNLAKKDFVFSNTLTF